ncbi:MAG TPA: hypothetical protein VF678_00040 [bacterium]
MSCESGVRTILARADGGVSIHAASWQRRGAASVDSALAAAEAKALVALPGARVAARVSRDDAPADRRLRNAWRVDAATGRVTVDLPAARRLRAEQWSAEAEELRAFIRARLLPAAALLGQRDAVQRLNGALAEVDRVVEDLAARIGAMTAGELASHAPAWPGLKT